MGLLLLLGRLLDMRRLDQGSKWAERLESIPPPESVGFAELAGRA
ncbi:hypothetical protein [Cypionkella psychrotolerans]|nr:hypothetical protein [Cypionkella psychrotolerans]